LGKDIIAAMLNENCEVRVPEQLIHLDGCLKLATAADYGVEFLAPILAVAIVNDVESAVAFINKHNSQHTDAIVTEDDNAANYFLRHVSSAIALHNASTQFADGGEFGKGAEVGIATGKLHARGPVGLEELTTYQYRVHGTGQIRPL
jgi:glutamate-5-semialdehyde dehydrogenase